MTNWGEIARELYRDGMPKQTIREKLDMTAAELNSHLVGEPAPIKKTPVVRMSQEKQTAFKMLQRGMEVVAVHDRLRRMGFKAALSTVAKWRWEACGPVNNKIDRTIMLEIIEGHPEAGCYEVAAIYAMRTGVKVSHQSADYWIRKMKKSKEAA